MIRWILAASIACGPAFADIAVPKDAQIIVLGEIHDNVSHHAEQARLVASVRPGAVVWEMLTARQVDAAKGTDVGNQASLERAFGWNASGWPDFSMYYPIFAALNGAAMVGGSAPETQLRAAIKEGALAVWGPVGSSFDPNTALGPLAPGDLTARKAEQAEAHCNALPPDMLGGMVEAQRLRDAFMADAALRALDAGQGPVVIITGSGHARKDVGIPAMIRAARPEVRVWSLGQVAVGVTVDAPYDAVNEAGAAATGDPCEAFR